MKTGKPLIAAVAALALSATGALAQQDTARVGFIYVGPVGDHGWSYQHDQGRQAVEAAFGDKVETTFVESVPESDAERAIEQFARTGHDIVFTTSFGFMEPTLAVAARYPDVKFEHATGYKRADNVATYAAKFHEGRYIIGQIAARMSESGIIGYVGAFPIPEVIAGINAFMLGAQSIDPEIELRVVWVNSWYDPAREADAATALLDQGVDVITQHTDSPAPLQAAADRGALGFGQASDMERFAPDAQLTSIIDNWNDYYVQRVQAVLDGTWESGDVWGGLDSGMVEMAAYENMPEDVKALAETTEAAIASGEMHPFTCPVFMQDGSEVPCEGDGVLSDGQILGMSFYVQGIDAQLPN